MSTLWFFGGSDLELQNDSHISHINRRAVWSWTPLNHVGNGLLKTQMFLSATWMEIIFFGSCSLQQWWHLPSNSAVMVISDLWPRHQKSSGIRLCRGFYLKCWYPKRIWRHLKWAFGGNLCDITIPPSESWDLKSLVIWRSSQPLQKTHPNLSCLEGIMSTTVHWSLLWFPFPITSWLVVSTHLKKYQSNWVHLPQIGVMNM